MKITFDEFGERYMETREGEQAVACEMSSLPQKRYDLLRLVFLDWRTSVPPE